MILHSTMLRMDALVRDNFDFQQRSLLILASTGRIDPEALGKSMERLQTDRSSALKEIHIGHSAADAPGRSDKPAPVSVVSALSASGKTAFSSLEDLQNTLLQMQETLKGFDSNKEQSA